MVRRSPALTCDRRRNIPAGDANLFWEGTETTCFGDVLGFLTEVMTRGLGEDLVTVRVFISELIVRVRRDVLELDPLTPGAVPPLANDDDDRLQLVETPK
jgi:hypothetical protein